MVSEIPERLWEQQMNDGIYDTPTIEQDSTDETKEERDERRRRHMAYVNVYLDPASPLYQPSQPRDMHESDRRLL